MFVPEDDSRELPNKRCGTTSHILATRSTSARGFKAGSLRLYCDPKLALQYLPKIDYMTGIDLNRMLDLSVFYLSAPSFFLSTCILNMVVHSLNRKGSLIVYAL